MIASEPVRLDTETQNLTGYAKTLLNYGLSADTARKLIPETGAIVKQSHVQFGFWNPDLINASFAELELFRPTTPLHSIDYGQKGRFSICRFKMDITGSFAWLALKGIVAGNRDIIGDLYRFRITDSQGSVKKTYDPMASSLPFGAFAPAEIYDLSSVQNERTDKSYYNRSGLLDKQGRVRPSVNLLEIHVPTATKEGTIHSLTDTVNNISEKLRNDRPLTSFEQNFIGFDGVELMPIEPVAQHPGSQMVRFPETDKDSEISVRLKKPNIINWGYDVLIFGTAAVNPSLLSSGRPHEILDLIEAFHNFSAGSVKVILDVVFGHADEQSGQLLPDEFFSGSNFFGKELNIRHPAVRAILLEMLKRKMNWGFDGIRVDASHDLKYIDESTGKEFQDDRFLLEMGDIEITVGETSCNPWMIYEDGRPWPRKDWILAATYRDLIEKDTSSYQWGPMTFAYNNPYKYTYWPSKWWRIREIMNTGQRWITGYANHDIMRRGSRSDPNNLNVNHYLGNSPKEIIRNAYNNTSSTLLLHGFLPGVPMDFLQALSDTPWGFFRNTDAVYSIKVAAEDAQFLKWQATSDDFEDERFFHRLKLFGFESYHELLHFITSLSGLLEVTRGDLKHLSGLLNAIHSNEKIGKWTEKKLFQFSESWMNDLYEYCKPVNHKKQIDPVKSTFNLKVRRFRLKHSWLQNNFNDDDQLVYSEPVKNAFIICGYRSNPDTGEELILMANLEGKAELFLPELIPINIDDPDPWEAVIQTPNQFTVSMKREFELNTSGGAVFKKVNR